MTPPTLRVRPRARYLLVAATCAAAAACGAAAPAGSPAPSAKVSLDIKVTGPGVTENWTLRCDPPGGSHPDPATACHVLLQANDPFAPVPRGLMCPMIAAGTRVAKVTGTYFGQHIDSTFTQGGCQEARWSKIGQIFY